MKGSRWWAVAAVVLGLGVAGVYAWAQDEGSATKSAPPTQPARQGGMARGYGCCAMRPMGGPLSSPMTGGQGMREKGQPMGPKGMSGPMMMRCRMMMGAAPLSTDPAAILALRSELGLTQEQVGKLQGIVEQARAEAWTMLTEEQKRKLAETPAGPTSMMQMCQQMMKQMSGGTGGPMMCPMMGRGPGTQSTPQPGEPTK